MKHTVIFRNNLPEIEIHEFSLIYILQIETLLKEICFRSSLSTEIRIAILILYCNSLVIYHAMQSVLNIRSCMKRNV